jgi:hypothetical protein
MLARHRNRVSSIQVILGTPRDSLPVQSTDQRDDRGRGPARVCLVVVRDRGAGDPRRLRGLGVDRSLPRCDGNPVGVHQSRLATIAEMFRY